VILGAVALVGATIWWFGAAWWTEGQLLRADPNGLPADPAMMRFALPRGHAIYDGYCATCHAAGGRGDPVRGMPALNDSDWLYGAGTPADIERTVAYGVRSRHPKAWNLAAMPAYAREVPSPTQALRPLSPAQISDLVEFLTQLQGDRADEKAAARGAALYAGQAGCYDCHAPDARGDPAIGAPNLTDRIWLYGDGTRAALYQSIAHGHAGVCPSWLGPLSAAEVREVALFVYALSHQPILATAE